MCAMWIAVLIAVSPSLQASRVAPGQVGSFVDVESEAGLKEWEKEMCKSMATGFVLTVLGPQKQVKASADKSGDECRKAVDAEEAHCKGLDVPGKRPQSHRNPRCNQYNKEKKKIVKWLGEPKPTHKIRDAVKPCEDEVEKVCKESLCPTYLRSEKGDELKRLEEGEGLEQKEKEENLDKVQNIFDTCEDTCDKTVNTMWKTGAVNCTDDEKFQDCLDRLEEDLRAEGRYKALEAILREHTLKCMCVTWRTKKTRDICYSGGKGIPAGRKWCEFYDTPSWVKVLKKIDGTTYTDGDLKGQLNPAALETIVPPPKCSEIPGTDGDVATAEMKADLCGTDQNAAPHTCRLSLGAMLGLVWLLASMQK